MNAPTAIKNAAATKNGGVKAARSDSTLLASISKASRPASGHGSTWCSASATTSRTRSKRIFRFAGYHRGPTGGSTATATAQSPDAADQAQAHDLLLSAYACQQPGPVAGQSRFPRRPCGHLISARAPIAAVALALRPADLAGKDGKTLGWSKRPAVRARFHYRLEAGSSGTVRSLAE